VTQAPTLRTIKTETYTDISRFNPMAPGLSHTHSCRALTLALARVSCHITKRRHEILTGITGLYKEYEPNWPKILQFLAN